MKRKIICVGMISIFLLSGLSLTAAGMNASDVKKSSFGALENKPNLYCPSIMITNDGFSTLNVFVDIANEMINIPVSKDETFDISFYFNDEETAYYTIEDYSFDYDEPGTLQWVTIVSEQGYDDFDYPEGSFTIKVKLDSNNDIDEEDETDNIAVSESVTSKAKALNPVMKLLESIFKRFDWNFPILSRLF